MKHPAAKAGGKIKITGSETKEQEEKVFGGIHLEKKKNDV